MANITVQIDVSKAVAALQAISGPGMQTKLSAALTEAALFGERTVVGFTPVRTGAARGSVKASRLGPLGWKIASSLIYIRPLEEGSRAHIIRPHGRVLRFVTGGGVVYARSVNHPGTRPRRMFAQSVPRIQAQLVQIVARILAR